MAVDTQQILSEAEKLGKLVAEHPAINRFKDAQKSVANDPEASRLLQEFDRTLEALGRQEQAGMPVTDAQRMQIEAVQQRIVGNLKIKAMNMAQVEFVDILRKVTQTIQAHVQGGAGGGAPQGGQPATAPASKIVM